LLARMLPAQQTTCANLGTLNILPPDEQFTDQASLLAAYKMASNKGNDIVRFINDPGDSCRFAAFQLLSAMLDKLEVVAVSVAPPATASKPITVPTSQTGMSIKIQNDAASSDTPKVNFALNQVTNPCVLAKGTAASAGNLTKDTAVSNPLPLTFNGHAPPADATAAAERAAGKPTPPAAHPAAAPAEHPAAAPAAPDKAAAAVKPKAAPATEPWETFCKDETLVKIVPRSPEAMVFYLGQLIEAENPPKGEQPFVAMVHGLAHDPYPLFDVKKGGSGGGAAEVSVSIDGETYYIPSTSDFRSTMHTLTLVEQVIGLQKKGTQTPGLVPVQVINP